MIKAILWDNDGTLIETEAIYRALMQKVCKKYSIDLPHEFIDTHGALAMKDYFQAIIHHYNLDVTVSEMKAAHKEVAHKRDIKLTPHIKSVLHMLSTSYRMGLVSNASQNWLTYIQETFGLKKYFEVVVSIDDVVEGKPSSECYTKATHALELGAREIIVVEDSTSGFQAAKSAGMRVIARRSEYNQGQKFELADYVVEDLRKIPSIIAEIQ